MFKYSIPLNKEEEDVECEIESVNPDAAPSLVRKRSDIDALPLGGRANPKMGENYASPSNIRRCTADTRHVAEDLAGREATIHET